MTGAPRPRRALLRAGLALPALAAACAPAVPPAPPARPRLLVGEPYRMGGVWSYPREDFALDQTGLGTIAADARAGRVTANGEIHDPAALSAAHRTVQLPAILRVTNLETGLVLLVRANDRGPEHAGRVLEVSRRAAELLGMRPGQPAQLRVAIEAEASRALAAGLPQPEAPRLELAAAPTGQVLREELAPPPGAAQAARLREARPLPGAAPRPDRPAAPATPGPPAAPALPMQASRTAPRPGRLFVEAASFSRRDLADRQAARIGGRVEAVGPRGRQTFRVRIGPLSGVAEADRALERTLASGVSEARILVDWTP